MLEGTIRTPEKTHINMLSWLIFFLVLLFYFYENILRIVPSMITQQLSLLYHLNAKSLSDLFVIFYLIYAPMQLLVGVLLDRYNPRILLTAAILCCALGIALLGGSNHFEETLWARFLTGFGASFAFISALKILASSFSNERFAVATGVVIAIGVLGGVFGDLLLNDLMFSTGWRLACLILAGLGLALAVTVFFVLRRKSHRAALREDEDSVFSFFELFRALKVLLQNTQFWLNATIASLLYIPILGFTMIWQMGFLQRTGAYDAHSASTSLVLVFSGWAMGAPVIGWLSEKITQRRLLVSVCATITTILLAAIFYVPSLTRSVMSVLLFSFGFFSSIQAITYTSIKKLICKKMMATAMALTSTIIMVGSVSVCLLGALLDWLWHGEQMNHLPHYSIMNYQQAFLVLLIVATLAVLLSFFVRDTHNFT